MHDEFNDLALRAAINLLRDSVECGRMPSGEPLAPVAAEMHKKTAEHFEAVRRAKQAGQDRPSVGRDVLLSSFLSQDEAWTPAKFCKRIGFADFRTNAQDDREAYAMRDANDLVRRGPTRATRRNELRRSTGTLGGLSVPRTARAYGRG